MKAFNRVRILFILLLILSNQSNGYAETHAPLIFYNLPNWYSGGHAYIRYSTPETAVINEWDRREGRTATCGWSSIFNEYELPLEQLHQSFPVFDSLWQPYYHSEFCSTGNPNGGIGNPYGSIVRSYVTCDEKTFYYDIKQMPDQGICPPTEIIPVKNMGQGCCKVGNPINPAIGNKYEKRVEYKGTGSFPLEFSWIYNSGYVYKSGSPAIIGGAYFKEDEVLGAHRIHNYGSRIRVLETPNAITAYVLRPDGKTFYFNYINDTWKPDPDVSGTLIQLFDNSGNKIGWQYSSIKNYKETYDKNGKLINISNIEGQKHTLIYNLNGQLKKVEDSFSRALSFDYDDFGRIIKMKDPEFNEIAFSYDSKNNLSSVIYPKLESINSNPQRIYHYDDLNFPHALTGITDESGDRFATWTYDDIGRAISSEHANGTERIELSYNLNGTTSVKDSLGEIRVYSFENHHGVRKIKTISGSQSLSNSFDSNGNISTRTDFNENITQYIYDLTRNLKSRQTEAAGKPEERTTITQWHADYRLPTQISKPGQITDLDYDAGRLIRRTVIDTQSDAKRITNYSYYTTGSKLGLLQSMDGPRTDISDITHYDYTANGDLTTVTNALGQTTTLSNHDASGRAQTITDANGQITQLSYTPRGWLKSENRNGQIRVYDYDNVGQLRKLTLPNGSFSEYTYDAAHRLTDVRDNLGNTIHYTLDAMGNRTKTELKDPSGSLTRLQEQAFNQLSQLLLSIGGEGQITRYGYDLNGNQTTMTDPRNTGSDRTAAKLIDPLQTDNTSHSVYDALNRLVEVNQLQAASDSNDDVTATYGYNALDQLTNVTDPNGLVTTYTYNALDDLLAMMSPDTGSTTYTYDQAGNRLTQADARGVTTSYSYDALNRLKTIGYSDTSLKVTYTYDESSAGQNGIGRLTSMTDASGTTRYYYDLRGNVTTITSSRGALNFATDYAYNGADQLIELIYPSGRRVNYEYDSAGRIHQVTTTDTEGVTQNLSSNIDYQPFGQVNSQLYGNHLTSTQNFDLDDRQTSLNTSSILERNYGFDDANNITSITNTLQTDRNQALSYDGLSRLDDAQGLYGSVAYQYDNTSNRTQRIANSTTENYHYAVNSHHLQDINGSQHYSYDANGNTTSLPNPSISTNLVYGDHNRLSSVNGVTYTYNGNGQRVIKENGTQTHYHYDQNGQLLAETDANGETLKEYIYVNGQLIALAQPEGGSVNTTEVVLDNPDAIFSDNWPVSSGVTGFEGSNYQYHAGGSAGPGTLGSPIDNLQASFSDTWTPSTGVKQFYAGNYQYHAGGAAGVGTLGNPVDNLQATYTGTWRKSTGVKQFYAGNYQYHAAGSGANTATWSAGVSTSGSYDVYVNWAAHPNRASNAPFTIHHTNGNDTVTVNQRQNGGQWNLLGTYPLDNSSTISLSDNANGYVIADAITVLPAGTPPTVTPAAGETATWDLNVSNTASYDVYANWAAHANRASDAKYTIHHNTGSNTVSVNQQQNGGQWNLLGTYTLDTNSRVELSSIANGYVIADAVTVLPAGTPPTVIPDGQTATWNLNQSGEYTIYANWTAHANRATDAKYIIQHSGGSEIVTVNQQQNGGQWNLLGTYQLDQASQVVLSSAANGYVIADGIRLVSTGSSNTPGGLFYVHNDHLGTPQVITDENQAVVWKADYDPFGKAIVTTETITNHVRFPGQYFDGETGLHYNYFRYYDPTTGRYITSDPIGLDGGVNTYLYANANPNGYIDPTGNLAIAAPVIIEGGAILIAGCIATNCTAPLSNLINDIADTIEQCLDDENDCPRIEKEVKVIANEIRRRYFEILKDKNDLYNKAYCEPNLGKRKGTFVGHTDQITMQKNRLRKKIAEADASNCKVDPRDRQLLELNPPSCPAIR